MMSPYAPNESTRVLLGRAIDETTPPASLRTQILARHHRRTQVARLTRLAPIVSIALAVVGMWWLAPAGSHRDSVDWHARSIALETAWRESGDADWLRMDARAEPLLQRLHDVDSRLSGFVQRMETGDGKLLAQLWQERSEALSSLIEARRQGGLAVRL